MFPAELTCSRIRCCLNHAELCLLEHALMNSCMSSMYAMLQSCVLPVKLVVVQSVSEPFRSSWLLRGKHSNSRQVSTPLLVCCDCHVLQDLLKISCICHLQATCTLNDMQKACSSSTNTAFRTYFQRLVADRDFSANLMCLCGELSIGSTKGELPD